MHKETDSAIKETSEHSYCVLCACTCVWLRVYVVCARVLKAYQATNYLDGSHTGVFAQTYTYTSTHRTQELEKETDMICEDRTFARKCLQILQILGE